MNYYDLSQALLELEQEFKELTIHSHIPITRLTYLSDQLEIFVSQLIIYKNNKLASHIIEKDQKVILLQSKLAKIKNIFDEIVKKALQPAQNVQIKNIHQYVNQANMVI